MAQKAAPWMKTYLESRALVTEAADAEATFEAREETVELTEDDRLLLLLIRVLAICLG